MSNDQKPFYQLGELLRKLRIAAQKTHQDVSGAVEIDVQHIQDFENGDRRPSQDILILLIEHFEVSDNQAQRLWSLAGYDGQPSFRDVFDFRPDFEPQPDFHPAGPGNLNLPQIISMGIQVNDQRVAYTDLAKIEVNDFGLVMNFMQMSGTPQNKPMIASRVGMSHQHAQRFFEILKTTLREYEEHQLAEAKKKSSPKSQKPITKKVRQSSKVSKKTNSRKSKPSATDSDSEKK